MQDELEDPSDLPTDTQSGGANTKGSVNQGQTQSGNLRVAPEDNVAPSDREAEDEGDDGQDQERNFPARLFVTIERPSKGALQVEAVAQDGVIGIENIYYYKDAKLVDPQTQEHEAAAARTYTGPPFGNLDEDLQVLFEKYLDERGVNTTMALFVPEYIDYKELREYLGWMKSMCPSKFPMTSSKLRIMLTRAYRRERVCGLNVFGAEGLHCSCDIFHGDQLSPLLL